MMEDPIVDEVHDVRRQIFDECGRDIERLIERLKSAELNDLDRIVTAEEIERHRSSPSEEKAIQKTSA